MVSSGALVTETNYAGRTYHRSAVADLGLDAAVFLKLNEIIQGVPWPCAAGGGGFVRALVRGCGAP